MSDYESSPGGDSDAENAVTVEMFQCRKCPGKLFTAAEKDLHRKMHKKQKERARENGEQQPSRRTENKRGQRAASPANSDMLFTPVSPNSQEQSNKRPRRDQDGSPVRSSSKPGPKSKKKKIRSVKRPADPIRFDTTTGG